MALLFMDGFEHYATADATEKWTSGTPTITTTQKRTGSYSAGSNSWTMYQALAPSDDTFICGFGIHASSGGQYFELHTGGVNGTNTRQCSVYIQTDGAIRFTRGSYSETELGRSAAGVFRFGVWNYLEAKIVLSQTVGTCTIKLNGSAVLTLTGLDNCYQTATTWTVFYWYNSGPTTYVDDLYICDGSGSYNNDFVGECRVVTLFPQTDAVAAGSNADFTCSTGTDHGALVDDATPNDDTDYVSSSTANHVDTWEYPALGYTGTIKGVQMNLSAKKTDSGARAIAAVTRPASTNRVHATNHYIGTSYAYWRSIWEVNPEDSAAWEVADIDGAEFGVTISV